MFINYYYYTDLLYCVFCLNYIFELYYNHNFALGNYSFICFYCIKKINKLFFIFNYSDYFIFEKLDFYDKYYYCYKNCLNCIFYFKNNLKKNIILNCEFNKNKNYYNNYKDFYNSYKYCYNFKCKNCFYYYNEKLNLYYLDNFLKFLKIYYEEFKISYNFYKYENNFFGIINPDEIYFFLNKFIIGQERAKKQISISIYNHYKRIKLNLDFNYDIPKSNILMIGPSGSGKTFLIKTISKILNIPIIIVDATTLTEVGYVGEDVENIIQKLFIESNFDLDSAENGIIFIDEIDKISAKNIDSNNRDISGEGVQQSLLKVIESTICPVFAFNDFNEPLFLSISTENILFICGGAFPGIDNIFEESNNYFFKNYEIIEKFNIFNSDKLIKFGIIPELIGRLPLIIKFDILDIFFLKKILYGCENSLINYYNDIFSLENVKLSLTEKSANFISEVAFEKNLGSRGLRNILDNILLDIMYKLPNLNDIKEIIVHNHIFLKKKNRNIILKYGF